MFHEGRERDLCTHIIKGEKEKEKEISIHHQHSTKKERGNVFDFYTLPPHITDWHLSATTECEQQRKKPPIASERGETEENS